MKNRALRLTVCLLFSVIAALSAAGCGKQDGHKHDYKEISARSATCEDSGNILYYECSCGKYFVKNGDKYEEKNLSELTLPATGHTFDKEIIAEEYLAAEATAASARKYYKSCVCGAVGTISDTFSVGKTLAEYEKEDKTLYEPVSLTVSLYDAENCVYGFTWNTAADPARSVVRICKGKTFGEYTKTGARAETAESYESTDSGDKKINYFVSKAEIKLEPNTEYTYTVGDEYLKTTTEATTIKTVNPAERKNWRFTHVSDSQAEGDGKTGADTGKAFKSVLKNVVGKANNRFLLHTGDVVEYSKYESYWKNMLHENFAYLSKIPVMAISGNHETTYKNGAYETYKHFDYKIPEQYTDLGFYYSFSYGGVKFIMLNTNRLYGGEKLTSDQYSWLEEELKNKTERWTIVAMHNPMYSVGKWGSDPAKNGISRALTAQLGKLFADYKVDLVLQGHDHMVSRTHPINADGKPVAENRETVAGVEYSVNPDGVIYVMNGPAGDQKKGQSSIYSHDESLYEYAEISQESSWAEFAVSENDITVYVRYANAGAVKTTHIWGIKKSA